MSDRELEDFVILREMDEPLPETELMAAGKRSNYVARELRDEGVDIRWLETDVLLNEDERATGTVCRFRAESEAAVRDHAHRAGLPATHVARRGPTIDSESAIESLQ